MRKPFPALTEEDLAKHSVWEFLPETDEQDEAWMHPVVRLPVVDLAGRLVGTDLRLASGQIVTAVLGNISLQNARHTQHFLTVTLLRADGQTFDLARYHDVDADRRGPSALANFLGLRKETSSP